MSGLAVGAAVVEVTPPAGLAMAGYAARTAPAAGAHDPLTVRAVCVDDTALVTVDVVGLHEDSCAEVRRRCPLPDDRVVVHATHTHGGPASMPGRLGGGLDQGWLDALLDACVTAVATAARRQRSCTLHAGYGADPGVARNRRRPDGPVDDLLPTAWFTAQDDGQLVAVITSYACHPVVLGADNTHWTADYPGVVRAELEERHPGAVALFVTGCAGDANNGHSAHASISTAASPSRTFAEAARVGRLVATAADAAPRAPAAGGVAAASAEVRLDLDVPTAAELRSAAARWQAEAAGDVDPATAVLLEHWVGWARSDVFGTTEWTGPVTALRWGDVRLVALPGEPFAVAAASVRDALGAGVTFVAGYSGGCPGYLPAREEYPLGGYEVCEAHRFYGLPGPFAAGSLERLVDRAVALAADLTPRPRGA